LQHRAGRLVIPAVLIIAGLLVAPALTTGAPRTSWDARACGRTGGTLVFGQAQDTVSLDPNDIEDGFSVNNTSNLFDNLVRFRPDSTAVEPSLAESWTVSPDGKTWTFRLRRGVRFHDGTPFNAEAVKFTYDRQIDKKHPYFPGSAPYATFTYQNVTKVDAVDASTVRFTLSAPFAPFLSNMAMFSTAVVSPTAVKKWGKDFFKHPTGTGAFKFVEWVQKDHITMEANREYWSGRPCVDRLIIRGIPDNTVRLLEMEKGSIHMMDQVNPPDYGRIRNNSALVLYTGPGLNTGYIALNMLKEPLTDVRVRRAVNMSVNKAALIRAFYAGVGQPAKNPIPPTIWSYNNSVQATPYDPEGAKKLLNEAGYPNGITTELWWPNRARPYLTQPQKIAEAIQAQLAKGGIRAKLVTYEWGTYLQKISNAEHPMAIIGWIGDNGDPDNFLYVLLDKDNAKVGDANNYSFYRSEALHTLLIKAQQVGDQAARTRYYQEAQGIIARDAPWVPLVHAARVGAHRKEVQNFQLHPLQIWWLHRVWLSK
jgi:peptide/nickel transport system substrate-binding protein